MPTGSVTQANMKLSIVNGTAFCDFSSASVLTDYLGYRLEVSDTAGKKLIGYIKAAGTGETYGSEENSSAGATSDPNGNEADGLGGWSAQLTPDTLESTSSGTPNVGSYHIHVIANQYNGFKLNVAYTNGALRFVAFDGKVTSGTAYYTAYSAAITKNLTFTNTSYASKSMYYTVPSTATIGNMFRRFSAGSGEFYIDNVSLRPVTAPSSTGVTITSTADGSTYNWSSEESGFNRNDSSGYTYLIQKSLPVFTHQYNFRRR